MDRIKAKGARNRNKFGTRLKYTSRPRPPNSPTATSFIVERRFPANYKTVKTSSRSTIATSSSLSTYNLDEEYEDTDRQSPDEDVNDKQIPGSPKQAFRTHRESNHNTSYKDNTYEDRKQPFGVTNDVPDYKDVTKLENKDLKKVPGYDADIDSNHPTDSINSGNPGLDDTSGNGVKERQIESKMIELEYVKDVFLTSTESVESVDSKSSKKEERSKKKEKSETYQSTDNIDTKKDWLPVVSKPRSGGAQTPQEKCLNECGKCGESDSKLKLLPCLHSYCLKCLETQVFETYRKMVRCTLCESKTVLPAAGLDSLENNYYFHFSELSLSENDPCEICFDKTPSSRCTECRLTLCSECVKDHLVETDKNHYVVNVSIEMIGHAPWNALCKRHTPFNLELFCINCSQLICGRCVLERHNNHVTENAEMYAREKRRQLESKLNGNSSLRLVSDIDDHIKLLERERESVKKDIDKTVDAIKDHVMSLKTKLDTFCEQLVGDLKVKGNIYTSSFDNKVETSQKKRKATYISLETLKQIVHRTRDIEFLNKYSDLVEVLSDMDTDNRIETVPHLEIGYVPLLDSLNQSVGRVNVNAKLKKPLKFTEEISIQFPRHVVTIYPVDQVRAWVGFRKHIQQCAKDGTLGLRISVGDHVVCIDKSSSDTLYIACRACVKVLTNKLQLKQLFELSHEPSDMRFNRSDSLIISFKDARRVALFSNRGTPMKEFDIRHFGYRFGVKMNDPWKLAITDNHDILLTDYTSEHIAVFNEECEMSGTFRSNVYKQASIGYSGGLVYIVDYKRDCLNVFSTDGYFLQTHQLEGLKAPSCIAVISGTMWIGSWNGLVKCYHIK